MSAPAQRMISCREFVERVTDALEVALPAAHRAEFEAHVEICPGCQAYMDQMRDTLVTLGQLVDEHVSDDARARILAGFRDWQEGSS